MQKSYTVKLELFDKEIYDTKINYVVGDSETMPVYIQLLSKGSPAELPDNATVELNFQNPKGERFPRVATVTENAELLYNIDAADIAIDGHMMASVTVTSGSERLTWQGFSFEVSRSIADNQAEPPDVLAPWKDAMTMQMSNHEERISYLEAFGGGSSEGGGGTSDLLWKPDVDTDGNISWTRSASVTVPAVRNIKGARGERGEQGVQGEKGEPGDAGPQGLKGDTGERGLQGLPGEKGDKGEKGDTGAQGPQGERGVDGAGRFAYQTFGTTMPSMPPIEVDDLASGWVAFGTGTMAHTTTEQLEGNGAIKITNLANNTNGGMYKNVNSKDYSQCDFRLWMKTSNYTQNFTLAIIFETSPDNDFSLTLTDFPLDVVNNEWMDWNFTQADFEKWGAPDWKNINKIYLRVRSATVAITLIDSLTFLPRAERGVISICFDDSLLESYTNGLKPLEKYGYKSTYFVIHNMLDQAGYMTQIMIDELAKKGHEISGHGNANLSTLNDIQLEEDLFNMAKYLNDRGYKGSNLYAYPNGANDERVRKIVRKYFPFARTINWFNQPLASINPLRINAFSSVTDTPVSRLKTRIDDAINNGNWLILVFHIIKPTPLLSYEYSLENYTAIIDYLKEKNANVQLIGDVLSKNDYFVKKAIAPIELESQNEWDILQANKTYKKDAFYYFRTGGFAINDVLLIKGDEPIR